MTKYNYSRAVATAIRMIERYGQTTQMSTPGAMTGSAQSREPSAPVVVSVTVVDLSVRVKNNPGDLVARRERRVYMHSLASPTKNSSILLDGKWHEIVELDPLRPGGVIVYWKAKLKQ